MEHPLNGVSGAPVRARTKRRAHLAAWAFTGRAEWASCLAASLALALVLAPAAQAAGVIPRAGKTYQNNTSNGAYKWMDEHKGACTGCVFRNLTLTVDRYGFQFMKGRDVLIDGVKVTHRRPSKGGDFPAGVAISGGDNITIRNSEFGGFQMVAVKGKYTNGDGVDCDARAARVIIEDTYAHDNSDGGFDLKCTVTLSNLRAERNSRNYRLWGKVQAAKLWSRNPRNAHVWFSSGANGVIQTLVAEGDNGVPVFGSEPEKTNLTVEACVYNFTVPTKVFGTRGQRPGLNVGPSCMPDAQGYAINNAADGLQLTSAPAPAPASASASAFAPAPAYAPAFAPAPAPDLAGMCAFAVALSDSNGDKVIKLGRANAAKCGGEAGLMVKLIGRNRAGDYVYDRP